MNFGDALTAMADCKSESVRFPFASISVEASIDSGTLDVRTIEGTTVLRTISSSFSGVGLFEWNRVTYDDGDSGIATPGAGEFTAYEPCCGATVINLSGPSNTGTPDYESSCVCVPGPDSPAGCDGLAYPSTGSYYLRVTSLLFSFFDDGSMLVSLTAAPVTIDGGGCNIFGDFNASFTIPKADIAEGDYTVSISQTVSTTERTGAYEATVVIHLAL